MFNGYLIKLGGEHGTVLPLKYMRYETYKITPEQRLDFNSSVSSSTGVLHRTVLPHRRTKIEFNTPRLYSDDMDRLLKLIRSYWTNDNERKITLKYYSMERNDYLEGVFYMPDIDFTISNVDIQNRNILYTETRLAFIEY